MNTTNLLPQQSKTKGFTLIELMIVIAIIAVLSVIGATLYGGAQKSARDSKRVQEMKAIANALEANFGTTTTGQYPVLATTYFVSGAVPTDPLTGSNKCGSAGTAPCKYCARTTAAECVANDNAVSVTVPAAGASWIICANLETKVANLSYYCLSNQQQ